MTLTEEQLDLLRYFCDDNDYRLREDYSGRCMFGKDCVGIVTDDGGFEVAMKMVAAFRDEDNELLDIFMDASSRQDSMGLSRIIYFPGISVPVEEEVE